MYAEELKKEGIRVGRWDMVPVVAGGTVLGTVVGTVLGALLLEKAKNCYKCVRDKSNSKIKELKQEFVDSVNECESKNEVDDSNVDVIDDLEEEELI